MNIRLVTINDVEAIHNINREELLYDLTTPWK